MMERRVLFIWHLAVPAAMGFIKTAYIPHVDYLSL